MGKGRLILLSSFFAMAMIAGLFFFRPAPRPVYEGKPLSDWLSRYGAYTRYHPVWQITDQCLRSIGTNAIPTLLEMTRVRDSNLELKLISLCQRQRFVQISHVPAATLNMEAAYGFEALGAQGASAVPELENIFKRNISKPSRDAAAFALGSMGSMANEAVPVLLHCATNSAETDRFSACWALKQIHPRAGLMVPILMQALASKNLDVREHAAYLLSCYGAEAKSAVPALKKMRDQANDPATFYAVYALKQIESPAPTNAVAVMEQIPMRN